jgi:hypothetical protein
MNSPAYCVDKSAQAFGYETLLSLRPLGKSRSLNEAFQHFPLFSGCFGHASCMIIFCRLNHFSRLVFQQAPRPPPKLPWLSSQLLPDLSAAVAFLVLPR